MRHPFLGAAGEVLQQEWHAAERAIGQRAAGTCAGLLELAGDHGVDARIDLLDAGDGRVDQFQRRDIAAGDKPGLGGRVQVNEVGHGGPFRG
ncbi:hypothetical protein D9M68_836570 [compost metagenome]